MRKNAAVVALVLGTLWAWGLGAQSPQAGKAPPPAAVGKAPLPESGLAPSEVQSLRLQVAQKEAQVAQANVQIAQQNLRAALLALRSEALRVEAENGWPPDTEFSADTLAFRRPAAKKDAKEAK